MIQNQSIIRLRIKEMYKFEQILRDSCSEQIQGVPRNITVRE